MLKFGEKKISKDKIYAAKKPIRIWDVNVDNIVISYLIETKTNSQYLIGYSDKAIRSLVLIMTKMGECDKTFKFKDGDKDKNNKIISSSIDYEKLLEKYGAIWTKIEDLKNNELSVLPVHGDRYIKTKKKQHIGIKFILTFLALMFQKMIYNKNLLQSFLLILYLYTTTIIAFKYV